MEVRKKKPPEAVTRSRGFSNMDLQAHYSLPEEIFQGGNYELI